MKSTDAVTTKTNKLHTLLKNLHPDLLSMQLNEDYYQALKYISTMFNKVSKLKPVKFTVPEPKEIPIITSDDIKPVK